ncbi:MAG: tetratricopeptide repeat protein [Candidatus Aegiribacteria sp.]|nr:tetratricopeptide repeat protein [Candidatus Aegiribacteria sp.]
MNCGTLRLRYSSLSLAVIAVSLLISLSVFHPYPYDNVVTRWGLAERLVSQGNISIDPWSGLTGDKAGYKGHYYSDKSFLPSAVAAISVIPLRFLNGISAPDAYPIGGIDRYIAERLTVSLALLALLLLLRRYCKRDGLLPVIALGLGSILLPYSTLLYTHVPAAMLFFACYVTQRNGKYLASDILGALAVSYEYTLLLPFLVMLLYRDRCYWNTWRGVRVLLVLLLAFLPQLTHNWIAFGSPFRMGYGLEVESSFPVASSGFFGFTYPTPQRLFMILFSPERGIFFYMPWAALGFLGLSGGRDWLHRLRSDPLPVMVILYIVLYAAQNATTAGWAYGQRYLIAIVPFLALGLDRFAAGSNLRRSLAAAAVLPGIILALLGTFGELHLPVHPVGNPLPLPQLNISLNMMLRGHHSTWLLGGAGTVLLSAAALACWFAVMRKAGLRWISMMWIPPWLMLAVISLGEDWGGKVDYYRGVLAHHRKEWDLAVEYYEKALEDESAPEIIRNRLMYVRSIAAQDKEYSNQPLPCGLD